MAKVLIETTDLQAIAKAVANLQDVLGGIQAELPADNTNQASDADAKIPSPTFGQFKFGEASIQRQKGVDKRLVACANRALQLSLVDFVYFEGLRTIERQKILVANGMSRTMQSKHLDGLANDLVPFIGGKAVWDWDGCAKIAFAMDQAATEFGFAHLITWGGAWDRKLSDYGGRLELYMQEVANYKSRHSGSDFIDGPHFEILGPKQ